jgi:hypothetical protein
MISVSLKTDDAKVITIPGLLQELKAADRTLDAAYNGFDRRVIKKAGTARLRVYRQLERAQKAAVKDFARARKLRWSIGVWESVAELTPDFAANLWCETCAGHCNNRDGSRVCHKDANSKSADCDEFRSTNSSYRLRAVVLHTRHPFEYCMVYAYLAGLQATELEFSWYGYATAALFERVQP